MAAFSFRQRAHERVSSPEELDRLVKVALPRTWVALAGLAGLIVVAVIWASVARIPTTVDGEGFLLRQGGVHLAASPSAGVVVDVLHPVDTRVSTGQLLGHVRAADGTVVPVRSPSNGIVVEISANRGDYVPAGEPVVLVDPVDEPLVVYAYLPQAEAKQAHIGDRVEITVSSADAATYGFLLGRVERIADYPASQQRLRSILRQRSVAAQVNRLGPVVETLVRLDRDLSTPSSFVWSVGEGPPYTLTAGTSASASVVTGEQAPIEYVTG